MSDAEIEEELDAAFREKAALLRLLESSPDIASKVRIAIQSVDDAIADLLEGRDPYAVEGES